MRYVALVLLLLGCRAQEPARETPKDTGAVIEDIGQVSRDAREPSREERIRELVKEFVALVEKCDEAFFSQVEPERIKRWELPVDVKRMEETCDAIIGKFEGLMRHCLEQEVLDRFLDRAAKVADQYLLLCLRCKKVGVKERLPYIKELTELRDALRSEVRALKDSAQEVLKISAEEMVVLERLGPSGAAGLANRVFLSLGDYAKTLIVEPVRQGRPVPRYALKLADCRANRALELFRAKASLEAQGILGPAEALTHAFSAGVNFFTGDYFNAEDKVIKKMLGNIEDSYRRYRTAAKTLLRRGQPQ